MKNREREIPHFADSVRNDERAVFSFAQSIAARLGASLPRRRSHGDAGRIASQPTGFSGGGAHVSGMDTDGTGADGAGICPGAIWIVSPANQSAAPRPAHRFLRPFAVVWNGADPGGRGGVLVVSGPILAAAGDDEEGRSSVRQCLHAGRERRHLPGGAGAGYELLSGLRAPCFGAEFFPTAGGLYDRKSRKRGGANRQPTFGGGKRREAGSDSSGEKREAVCHRGSQRRGGESRAENAQYQIADLWESQGRNAANAGLAERGAGPAAENSRRGGQRREGVDF